MALPGTLYQIATHPAPGSDLSDGHTFLFDLSLMPAVWWNTIDTSDYTKGRAALDIDGTELATDWIDVTNNMDGTGTGQVAVFVPGTIASAASASQRTLRFFPPVAANSSYAAGDTYGSDNAYASTRRAYYPLGGGADRTSYGNTATAVNGPVLGDVAAPIGRGTQFVNANEQYFSINDSASMSVTSDLTNECLVYCEGTAVQDQGIGINKYETGTNRRSYRFVRRASNVLRANISADGSANVAVETSGGVLTNGQWHHVAMVYVNSTTEQIWVDGVLEQENTTGIPASVYDSDVAAWIGTSVSTSASDNQFFNGRMAQNTLHAVAWSADRLALQSSMLLDNDSFWSSRTTVIPISGVLQGPSPTMGGLIVDNGVISGALVGPSPTMSGTLASINSISGNLTGPSPNLGGLLIPNPAISFIVKG